MSILDVSLFKSPPLSLVDLTSDLITIDNGKADMSFIESEFQSSPIYANNLVSEDLRTTALLIPLSSIDPTAIVDDEILKGTITKIRSTMDEYRNDAGLFLGGVPMIRNDVFEIIKFLRSDVPNWIERDKTNDLNNFNSNNNKNRKVIVDGTITKSDKGDEKNHIGVFTLDMVVKTWTVAINPDYYLNYVIFLYNFVYILMVQLNL